MIETMGHSTYYRKGKRMFKKYLRILLVSVVLIENNEVIINFILDISILV